MKQQMDLLRVIIDWIRVSIIRDFECPIQGSLKIYIKQESQDKDSLEPQFSKQGDLGNRWMHGVIPLDGVEENFQVLIPNSRIMTDGK
jgi:hypothetical protein